jgi:amphi-Trp domain-containing protein
MSTFEVERREKVSRKEAATRLRRIANLIGGEDEDVKFERGGMQFELTVPAELEMKVELEVGGEENELEIEFTW